MVVQKNAFDMKEKLWIGSRNWIDCVEKRVKVHFDPSQFFLLLIYSLIQSSLLYFYIRDVPMLYLRYKTIMNYFEFYFCQKLNWSERELGRIKMSSHGKLELW